MLIDLLLLSVFHITGVMVITGWGYNQLYYFIDYAVSSALWAVVPINITNTNTTTVMVHYRPIHQSEPTLLD